MFISNFGMPDPFYQIQIVPSALTLLIKLNSNSKFPFLAPIVHIIPNGTSKILDLFATLNFEFSKKKKKK